MRPNEEVARPNGAGAGGLGQQDRSRADLFAKALIASYVDDPRFVPRDWLVGRVQEALEDPQARFVLLTGEPGSGKSALMAHLAHLHPEWPRYFIRRDSVTALRGGDARAFLFSVGHQLAHLHPSLFDPQHLELVVNLRAGRIASSGRAVGIEVSDLQASPFYQESLRVTAQVDEVEGELIGISAGSMTIEPRLLELSNLQYLALLDPAQALADHDPQARIVVLVDALDEVRYGARGEDVLSWLAACPELPASVRFVLTSRPDPDLLGPFRQAKAAELVELSINPEGKEDRDRIREDLRRFLDHVAAEPAVARALQGQEVQPTSFVEDAADKAEGNFQYAVALARGIDQALAQKPPGDNLPALLRLEGIPSGTTELYRFFLTKIKEEADRAPIQIAAGPLEEPEDRPAWDALYRPVLSVLAVAFESLSPEQLQAYAAAPPGALPRALQDLTQFLDPIPNGRYRLYHATFPEFLTGKATATPADPFHVDPGTWHGLLAGRLLRANPDWLACQDRYALAHTPAHLTEAIRLRAGQQMDQLVIRQELSAALTSLLTDFDFLEAKCMKAPSYELEADYRLALAGDQIGPNRELLQAFEERLRLESAQIQRAPELLFPHLYNHLVWVDSSQANSAVSRAVHLSCLAAAAARSGWLRMVQDPRPAGPPWRLAFEGHTGYVTAVAVTADGQHAVSASEDQLIRLWDLTSGSLLRVYAGHTAAVRAVAVTPGPAGAVGGRIVSGDYDGTLKIWDLPTGRVLRSVMAHTEPVTAVALVPGGELIISASVDQTLKIWELATGRFIRALKGHAAAVTAVAVTGDGQSVVSAAEDYTLKVWELATGRLVRSLVAHRAAVTALAVAKDGQRAVSAAEDDTVEVWRLAELLGSLPKGSEAPDAPGPPAEFADARRGSRAVSTFRLFNSINAVALVSGGRHAVLGFGSGKLETWDLDSAQRVRSFAGHRSPVTTVVATPDGEQLISGSWDQSLKLWDPTSGQLLRTIAGHTWTVTAIAVTPDGQMVVSSSMDNTLKVWELGSGRLLRTYEGHTANVSALALTPDGRRVLSGGADQTLRLWDLGSGRLVRVLEGHNAWVQAVAVMPDGRYALSGAWDGTLRKWELGSGRLVQTLDAHADSVDTVAVSPDGQHAVSSDGHMVKLWDLISGRLLHTFRDHEQDVTALAVTPDGRHAISASYDQTLRLWNLPARRLTRTLEGHSDAVTAVAITPDGRHVVSGSRDRTVRLWEPASGRMLHVFSTEAVTALAVTPDGQSVVVGTGQQSLRLWGLSAQAARRALEGHSDDVNALAMTPDGQQVLSASFDHTLRLWDCSNGLLVRTYEGHGDRVTAVAITPDGQYAVSGSADETVRVWDLATGRLLRTLKGHTNRVWTVALTPDGLHAISGSRDYTVRLWELATGRLVHTFVGHTANVTSVAVTPDGRAVVSGSRDQTFKVWDLRSRQMIRSVNAHKEVVSTVAITPDGHQLVTGSQASLKVWDLASGRLLQRLSSHKDWVTSLAFTSDAQSLVTGSADQTLRVWNLASGQSRVLFGNDDKILSVAIAAHGSAVACGDAHGRVWIFEWMRQGTKVIED